MDIGTNARIKREEDELKEEDMDTQIHRLDIKLFQTHRLLLFLGSHQLDFDYC